MKQNYWEQVCRDYENEVVSVLDCDSRGLVQRRIETMRGVGARAADLGCGVGKFLPLLSDNFQSVEACDFTETGLKHSRDLCDSLGITNVSFYRLDLTRDVVPFEPVELALCVNVLLMSSYDERMRSWRTVTNQVVEGGKLLLVVPALESILLAQHLERDQLLESGLDCEASVEQSLPEGSTMLDLHQGVHWVEGFPMKHYLKAELVHLFESHHFEVDEIHRLTYEIGGEKSESWDWFVVATRKRVS